MSQHNGNEEIDPADAALFAELKDAVRRFDPLPPKLAAAARAAFSWRTIDAELAALTHDTLLDDDRGESRVDVDEVECSSSTISPLARFASATGPVRAVSSRPPGS